MTLLCVEQLSYSALCQGMVFEPLCPVDQVAIVGAGCASDLDMPFDGGRGMRFERIACVGFELPPFVVVPRPHFPTNQVHFLVRLPVSSPGPIPFLRAISAVN